MITTRIRGAKPSAQPDIPWQDATTDADRRRLMKAAGVAADRGDTPVLPPLLRRVGAGPRGRFPGRVAFETRVTPHTESTRTLRGLYSWVTGSPLPIAGPLIGRDLFSGGHFCPDPWQHRKLGRIGDTGIFISGVIGTGKSSLAKTIVTRHADFGRPFVVPCDIRGEWVPVAAAVDGTVLRLGPGMPHRLNALAMPEKPDGVSELQWWLTVRTHWEELLVALIETVLRGGRDLTPTETTAIEVAITDATRHADASGNLDRLAPIHLHLIVDLLLNPTAAMAAETHMSVGELGDLLRESGLALRKLTRGSLQGLVDAPEANQLDPRSPGTVVDISRVQTSDASIALVMACTQAATELAWAHSVGQRWHVYDEFWRIATFGKLVARLDGGRRISRKTGAADMIVSHRGTDSMRGDAQAQRAAKDLMDNCATKVTYRQRGDSVAAAAVTAGMPDMAAMLLPTLNRGQAVWMLEEQPYVVQHLLAPGGLESFVETDQAMEDTYRTLVDTPQEQLWRDTPLNSTTLLATVLVLGVAAGCSAPALETLPSAAPTDLRQVTTWVTQTAVVTTPAGTTDADGATETGAPTGSGWQPAVLVTVPDLPRLLPLPADFTSPQAVAAVYLQAWCYQPADLAANTNITNTTPWMTPAGWADDADLAVDEPTWERTRSAGVSTRCGPATATVSPQAPNTPDVTWVGITAQQARIRDGELIGQSPMSMVRRLIRAADGRWLVDVRVLAG